MCTLKKHARLLSRLILKPSTDSWNDLLTFFGLRYRNLYLVNFEFSDIRSVKRYQSQSELLLLLRFSTKTNRILNVHFISLFNNLILTPLTVYRNWIQHMFLTYDSSEKLSSVFVDVFLHKLKVKKCLCYT